MCNMYLSVTVVVCCWSVGKIVLPVDGIKKDRLKKVLVTEEQNFGMASRTSREIHNLSVTLI